MPVTPEDYLDPEKRSIANAVQVFFRDGSATDKIAVEYPIGHRRRRAEGIPLIKKFEAHLNSPGTAMEQKILDLCLDLPASSQLRGSIHGYVRRATCIILPRLK